jgi:hypothetical protein
MSQVVIRKLLENRLKALDTAFPTAYENADYKPVTGTAYQEPFLLPNIPDNSSIGSGHYIELGLFQVNLRYPQGKGANQAQAKAEAIKLHFQRGTTLTENVIMLVITDTPRIAPAFVSDGWYVVPITINYQSDIYI